MDVRQRFLVESLRAQGNRPLFARDINALVTQAFSLTELELRHLLRSKFEKQLDLFDKEEADAHSDA